MSDLVEVFFYFLKLGATGFGGPVALVAIMQKELVEEKQWMDPKKFSQVLPLLKAMPGAFSFQVAVYLGQHRAGRWAGFLAGLALVLPAFFMMLFLGMALEKYGQIHELQLWINGFQWGAIVLMSSAVESLAKPYFKDKIYWLLTLISILCLIFFKTSELVLIFTIGLAALAFEKRISKINFHQFAFFGLGSSLLVTTTPTLSSLFVICLSSGALVFGTGVAIAPMLEKYFVLQGHWISHQDFMTALALGQMTPGPVLVTVTMIGYKTLGWIGAVLATFAVYCPGWVHMLTWFPKVSDRLVQNKTIQVFLKGALAAVVSAIVITLVHLVESGPIPQVGVPLLLLLFYINRKFKISSWKLIFGSGLVFRLISFLNIF